MSESQERLQHLAEHNRSDSGPRGHRRAVLVGAVLVLLLGFGISWVVIAWAGSGAGGLGGAVWHRVLSVYLDVRAADLRPPAVDVSPVSFEIAPGEELASVARRLEAEGLIRDAGAFRLLARLRGLDRGVQAGVHTLRASLTAGEVLDELQAAAAETVVVTLPEGRRAEEVADVLHQQGVTDRADFLALVSAGAGGDHPALADRPAGTGLEGFLFPDTYDFLPGTDAQEVVDRLLDTFEARFTASMRARASEQGLTVLQVVTLASIVERETALSEERGMVARVYRNRLDEPPYLLNADPTVQYGLGFQTETATWWKRPLLTTDLQQDAPYNTYLRPGLPPGPIASPGLAAMQAVLEPADGDWQYFVANDLACDGSHVFAVTYEEHLANVARVQTGECGRQG